MNDTMVHVRVNVYNICVCVPYVNTNKFAIVVIRYGPLKKNIYMYIYTCKLYKLINLCWSTGCFVKCNFTKQPVDQHRLINLYNLHV